MSLIGIGTREPEYQIPKSLTTFFTRLESCLNVEIREKPGTVSSDGLDHSTIWQIRHVYSNLLYKVILTIYFYDFLDCTERWGMLKGRHIEGQDDKTYTGVSGTACLSLCEKETAFKCASVDYDSTSRTCILSKKDINSDYAKVLPSASGSIFFPYCSEGRYNNSYFRNVVNFKGKL